MLPSSLPAGANNGELQVPPPLKTLRERRQPQFSYDLGQSISTTSICTPYPHLPRRSSTHSSLRTLLAPGAKRQSPWMILSANLTATILAIGGIGYVCSLVFKPLHDWPVPLLCSLQPAFTFAFSFRAELLWSSRTNCPWKFRRKRNVGNMPRISILTPLKRKWDDMSTESESAFIYEVRATFPAISHSICFLCESLFTNI